MTETLPPAETFFRVPGRRLAVSSKQAGSDTTLFFVHGLGGNRQQWRLQWDRFSKEPVNLVAWDALGHGESARSKHEQVFASRFSVQDLAAVLAAFPSRKRIIVAHSFGCRITLEWISGLLAAGEDIPVDGLILLGPASLAPSLKGPMFGNWMDRLPFWIASFARPALQAHFEKLAWAPDVDPEILKTERQATKRNSLFMINAVRSGAAPVNTEILRHFDKPVYILAGQNDGIVPLTEVRKVHDFLPTSTLDILPDCGHQIMLEQPVIVNQYIERELQRLSSSPGEAP
ncbi:alpha/beta hydrolase [Gluconobacter cerinus]|uniref:alpha/beta fold hydrolase n=1 Tax=Gluconobacter cerinus TaxID=38307 RepID=UPI001B8C01C9|nr:alpha/beta hydrolase [Gluconobacter cerinus]MBS0994217.1 alpha/beta hydrolase [Gluconobacter cerinus]MBS1022397.1 alpha/beta hydrolase [Gluconobacter cerinus]